MNHRVFVVIVTLVDQILNDRLQLKDKTAYVALVFFNIVLTLTIVSYAAGKVSNQDYLL
jgi:hypothetical protein